MKNLDDNTTTQIKNNLNKLFQYIYKKNIPKSKRIDINELNIIFPHEKTKKFELKYLKNKKNLLSSILANINKHPFIDNTYNKFAFEILWIILTILLNDKLSNRNIFNNVTLINNIGNTIKFGKYIFSIPKYKKYIFDVKGYNFAKLIIN